MPGKFGSGKPKEKIRNTRGVDHTRFCTLCTPGAQSDFHRVGDHCLDSVRLVLGTNSWYTFVSTPESTNTHLVQVPNEELVSITYATAPRPRTARGVRARSHVSNADDAVMWALCDVSARGDAPKPARRWIWDDSNDELRDVA